MEGAASASPKECLLQNRDGRTSVLLRESESKGVSEWLRRWRLRQLHLLTCVLGVCRSRLGHWVQHRENSTGRAKAVARIRLRSSSRIGPGMYTVFPLDTALDVELPCLTFSRDCEYGARYGFGELTSPSGAPFDGHWTFAGRLLPPWNHLTKRSRPRQADPLSSWPWTGSSCSSANLAWRQG